MHLSSLDCQKAWFLNPRGELVVSWPTPTCLRIKGLVVVVVGELVVTCLSVYIFSIISFLYICICTIIYSASFNCANLP
jgi:hypothetical protein